MPSPDANKVFRVRKAFSVRAGPAWNGGDSVRPITANHVACGFLHDNMSPFPSVKRVTPYLRGGCRGRFSAIRRPGLLVPILRYESDGTDKTEENDKRNEALINRGSSFQYAEDCRTAESTSDSYPFKQTSPILDHVSLLSWQILSQLSGPQSSGLWSKCGALSHIENY